MSRSLPVAGVLVFGCLLAFTASAQRYDDGSYRPYLASSGQWRDDDGRYDRDDNGPVYDYARVVRVDPIIVDGGGRQGACYERSDGDYVYDADGYRRERGDIRDYGDGGDGGYRQGSDGARQVATVIGGLAGAIIGSRIGGGDGRYLGTAIGTVAGGAAGRAIYDANNRPLYRRSDVRVCEPERDAGGYGYERERVAGYDVTYEYAGREYHTRRDYHPGERIRVRVDVSAD